jgi:catechol 2,3-dioxygenase-like lactoylglutathione lyase family enzyme
MGILTDAKAVTFVLVRDRTAAKSFYSDTLGLTMVSEDPFAATYDLGGTAMRLTTVEGHEPSPHTVLGWQVPDIRAAVSDLRERGVTFAVYEGFGQDELGIWTAPGGGASVAWFHDPEGNNLSLTQTG